MELNEETIRSLSKLPTGNVADNNPGGSVLDYSLQAMNPVLYMIGRAFPVEGFPGDNLPIHEAIRRAEKGDVLIVDCKGFTKGGHFGDVMATACKEKGLAGAVIIGTCRDREDIRSLGFPVYALGTCPAPTTKVHHASFPGQITVGNACIRKGDLIFGDGDGIVVVPYEDEDDVMQKALAKYDKEQVILQTLCEGTPLWDMLHFE